MLLDVIRFLSQKEIYKQGIKFIKKEFVTEEVWTLLQYVPSYYEKNPTKDKVSWPDFRLQYSIENPGNKNLVLIQSICDTLNDSESLPISEEVMQMFIDKMFAEKMIEAAEKVAEGKSKWSEIENVRQKYLDTSNRAGRVGEGVKSVSLVRSILTGATAGYNFKLPALTSIFGTLGNDFIFVAARPDGGKTTLLAQEAVNISLQLDPGKSVLWFNNEEHSRRVLSRLLSTGLGVTSTWIEENKVEALRRFHRKYGEDRIILIDDCHSWSVIEEALEKYNPGLVVIDQLYKVDSEASDALEAELFRKKCEKAREIAKHVCPVLASNQLDGGAEGVRYPPMSHLYGSKTGAQGAADGILMIGRVAGEPDKRYVYAPKNKLTGNNDYFEVTLDKEHARFL